MLLVTEHRFFIDFLTAPKRREMSEITHPYAAHVLYSPEQPFCMSVYQGCRGYGNPHGYGYGIGMGMIFHPHRPMGFYGDCQST